MATPRMRGSLRYPEYLSIAELLALQRPLSSPPHHDETLFIVVHQVFELWFKLILHDLDGAVAAIARDDARGPLKLVRRAALTLRRLVDQVDVLEGMSALDFLEFRSELEGASGFQSAQFRELEAVLGLHREARVPLVLAGSGGDPYHDPLAAEERERIARRQEQPGLEEALLTLIARRVTTAGDERVYLEDVVDALEAVAAEQRRGLIGAIAARATVGDRALVAESLARLAALPWWQSLGDDGRRDLAAAAAAGTLLERAAKLGRLDDDPAQAHAVRLVAEELKRRLDIPVAALGEELAGAGLAASEREALAARLDQRCKLRLVYCRDRHRPGPGETFDLFQLAEACLDLGEAFHLFRARHVRMVERMIGRRRGTGGSPGVAYLEQTLAYRPFPELLRVRTVL